MPDLAKSFEQGKDLGGGVTESNGSTWGGGEVEGTLLSISKAAETKGGEPCAKIGAGNGEGEGDDGEKGKSGQGEDGTKVKG